MDIIKKYWRLLKSFLKKFGKIGIFVFDLINKYYYTSIFIFSLSTLLTSLILGLTINPLVFLINFIGIIIFFPYKGYSIKNYDYYNNKRINTIENFFILFNTKIPILNTIRCKPIQSIYDTLIIENNFYKNRSRYNIFVFEKDERDSVMNFLYDNNIINLKTFNGLKYTNNISHTFDLIEQQLRLLSQILSINELSIDRIPVITNQLNNEFNPNENIMIPCNCFLVEKDNIENIIPIERISNEKFDKIYNFDMYIKEYSKKFKKPQKIEWL